MKILVIGCGQCGSRVADSFARLNIRARSNRRIEIVTGTFAVNTDIADLSGLSYIKSDYRHRIVIGTRKTGGHGVGKINEVGAQLAKMDSDKVIDAIRSVDGFYETDAFLVIAGTAGGTGSGSMPVVIQKLKERYSDKPVYALAVLPFDHEEEIEERTLYNSATSLKSTYLVADAVFLVDNQRYIKKDSSLANNMAAINDLIAEPFYNLLCAGEENKIKHIGSRVLDAGDIIQTLAGWTVLGYGQSRLQAMRLPGGRDNFRTKSTETHKGIHTMDAAINELSLKCDARDVGRALYLLAAPSKEMNMDLVKELGEYIRDIAPKAIIRYGDYPRAQGSLSITVVLSELSWVQKVKQYYDTLPEVMDEKERIQLDNQAKLREMIDASMSVPSLL